MSASLSISIVSGVLVLRNIRLDHLSVSWSVRKLYCGKMADWIVMSFRVVSGVGRGIGVLDGGGDRRRVKGSKQWGLCCIVVWKCVN